MEDFTKQFIKDCLRTESADFDKIRERLESQGLRATLKYTLESYISYANDLDILKKLIFYGKIKEENKDILFEDNLLLDDEETVFPNQEDKAIRLLHAGIGVATESAEFLQPILDYLEGKSELDEINLCEELLGDIPYYQGIGADALGQDSLKVWMDKIIKKLEARYGDKFTEDAANNRDLEKERKILES